MSLLVGSAWDEKLLGIIEKYSIEKNISMESYKYIYKRIQELSKKLSQLNKEDKGRQLYQDKYIKFNSFLQTIIDDDNVPHQLKKTPKPSLPSPPKPSLPSPPKPSPPSPPKPEPYIPSDSNNSPESYSYSIKPHSITFKKPNSVKQTKKIIKRQYTKKYIIKLDDSNILEYGYIVDIPHSANSALQTFIYGLLHLYKKNIELFDNPKTQKYIHNSSYSQHVISVIEWIKGISSYDLPTNAVNYSNSNEFNGYRDIFIMFRFIITIYYENHVKMKSVLNKKELFIFGIDELNILADIFNICIVIIDVPSYNLSVDSLMYCDNVLFVIKNVTHFTPFIHKESIFIEKKKQTHIRELGNKSKEYYLHCQRATEQMKYLEDKHERDETQLSKIIEKCNYENIDIEYKTKFNIPSFKSMHPTFYDMKSDLKESMDRLTSRLDKTLPRIYTYNCKISVGNILFYNLLYKYRSKCFVTPLNETKLKPPTLGNFNTKHLLGLFIDPTDTFEHVFPADYIKYLGLKLKGCISKSSDVILIQLIIYSKTASMGHSNMLIYKPDEKNIYRFEPNGSGYFIKSQDDVINDYLKILFETELPMYIDDITYIKPLYICPLNESGMTELRGLQWFEARANTKERKEGGGYCMMWSLLFAEMVLLNPKKPLIEIMNELFLITNKDPNQLRNIIRGYVKLSTDMLKEISSILFKKKINSYNDLGIYLDNTKDSKYSLIIRLLTLFIQQPRANSPTAGASHKMTIQYPSKSSRKTKKLK